MKKASEIIKALQAAVKEHGDLGVYDEDWQYVDGHTEIVADDGKKWIKLT